MCQFLWFDASHEFTVKNYSRFSWICGIHLRLACAKEWKLYLITRRQFKLKVYAEWFNYTEYGNHLKYQHSEQF